MKKKSYSAINIRAIIAKNATFKKILYFMKLINFNISAIFLQQCITHCYDVAIRRRDLHISWSIEYLR